MGDERRSCGVRRMVACAVAASAVHLSSSVIGGETRRAPLASPEVSRSALLPPPKAAVMAVTSVAAIEQLKQLLQAAVENKDSEKATLAIDELDRVVLTRDVLESTRIGLCVNSARKEIAELWPPLAKRCRALIKGWQKLVEPTTNSSSASTSRNGTPGLVSPAVVGRRLTPHTPANKRITPGVASERTSNVSPANGSYAPKQGGSKLSPALAAATGAMHKSHSVGFDLKEENGGGMRNGKRKPDEPGIAPSSLKRAKTTACGLSGAAGTLTSPAPSSTPSLIEARRAAVQSTCDLVAQLTSNVPQHQGFANAAKAHEEKVKRELEDQQLATALANGGEPHSPYVFDKKRKYERKKPITNGSSASSSSSSTTTVRIVTPPPDEERKGGLVMKLSLSRTTTDMGAMARDPRETPVGATTLAPSSCLSEKERKEEKGRRKKEKKEAAAAALLHSSKSAPALATLDEEDEASTSSPLQSSLTERKDSDLSESSSSLRNTSSSTSAISSSKESEKTSKKEKIDWFAMVPSIEELQKRVEVDKQRRRILEGMKDSEKAYTLRMGERVVLALPYIEIEDRPDFLKFNYPDPGRFYAEENFVGGLMERPVHETSTAPTAPNALAARTATTSTK